MEASTTKTVLTAVVFDAGLMALLALSFGMIERSISQFHARSIVLGCVFGLGAILAMLEPVHLTDGVIFDARAIIVGLAAAFAGWPAAVVSALFAGGYRLSLGGVGAVPGAAGIVIASAMGLLWSLRYRSAQRLTVARLLWLGAAISVSTLSILFLPAAMMRVALTTAIPALAAASFVCAFVMGIFVDRERRNLRAERSWQHRANTDPMTGLHNRRAFDQILSEMAAATGPAQLCALLLVDADHFKKVNDRHGHAAGDVALLFIAQCLRGALPEGAHTCRIGGEEFAIILSASTDRTAREVAETVRRTIDMTPFIHKGAVIPLSVSIGVAIQTGGETIGAGTLFRAADAALYAAKEGGRNRVVVRGEEQPISDTAVTVPTLEAPAQRPA